MTRSQIEEQIRNKEQGLLDLQDKIEELEDDIENLWQEIADDDNEEIYNYGDEE